jgi:hypothetical protein
MNFRRRGPKQTSEYQHAIERFDCYFDFAPTAASYLERKASPITRL